MENNNQNLQFKTNINCSGCVSKIKPHLDNADGVCHWDVDIAGTEKILTVASKGILAEEVVELVKKAGFKIEPLTQ